MPLSYDRYKTCAGGDLAYVWLLYVVAYPSTSSTLLRMRRPLVRLGMGLGLGLHGLACAAAMRTSMATVMTAASPLVKHTPPSVAERRININKPPLDDRAYRWVRLSNGLEALLVQDESAETIAG